jgi:cytochrome P450
MAPVLDVPMVRGLPLLGNALGLAKDPARFFVRCYREYGPVFRLRILNRTCTVIAGTEAANYLGTPDGREALRSKEFWQGLADEYGANRNILGEDGAAHRELRNVMRRGYSREAIKGRLNELLTITDRSIERDWQPGQSVPVVRAMQYLVTDQLGSILTGAAPLEYVPDICTTMRYILNVLVTRQRPKFMLRSPRYRRARARVFELSQRTIARHRATAATRRDDERNLIDDIMAAHAKDSPVIPASDLPLVLTGPYIAGMDTAANTMASLVYAILKHPEALKRIREEVDALFAGGRIDDDAIKRIPTVRAAVMETMRLYPVAVAQTRTAVRDFTFAGHTIEAGETVYVATTVPHFMAEYYPDPDTFDIDRYDMPRAEHTQSGAYSPYGRGPHTCLGKGLADVLMILTTARLFHRLDLELDPPGYQLVTKTTPAPGPSTRFKVRVAGYRS